MALLKMGKNQSTIDPPVEIPSREPSARQARRVRLNYEQILKTKDVPEMLKKYLAGALVDIEYASNNHVFVGVGGRVKSGKSILLNGLIGYEVIPDAAISETAVVCIIEHDPSVIIPVCSEVEIGVKLGLERPMLCVELINEPEARPVNPDNIHEHPELLREAFDKIREQLRTLNHGARAQINSEAKENSKEEAKTKKAGPEKMKRFNAYLIQCKIAAFGDEKVYLFDTPGINDLLLSKICESYYLTLLQTCDIWIEVVNAEGAPTDSAVTQQLQEFFLNIFLSGRNKTSVAFALNKFDHPTTSQAEEHKKAWITELKKIAGTLFPVDSDNQIFISGLNLLRYTLYENHKRFRQTDQEEINNELEGLPPENAERVIQKKVAAWKTTSNGSLLIEYIKKQYTTLHDRIMNSKIMQATMIEVLEDYIQLLTPENIASDIRIAQNEFTGIITPLIYSLKTSMNEIKKNSKPTREDVVKIGSQLFEAATHLQEACKLFVDVTIPQIHTKIAMGEHWKLVIAKAQKIADTCQKFTVVTENKGLFALMFSAKGAILLANATYLLRLGGVLATTWWCVPLCAVLCVLDIGFTLFLYFKGDSSSQAPTSDRPEDTWRNKILEIEKEFDQFKDYIFQPLQEMERCAKLKQEEKEQAVAKMRELQDNL